MPDHSPTVLVVDADRSWASGLLPAIEARGYSCTLITDFPSARREVRTCPPHALMANVRLAAFNGIHLAYLARMSPRPARVMVYAGDDDRLLAAEVRAAGAFYERQDFVPFALTMFLVAELPEYDRRIAAAGERRTMFRGGRRTTDIPALHGAVAT